MAKVTTELKKWVKPAIKPLGVMKDVAGKETAGPQSVNNKS